MAIVTVLPEKKKNETGSLSNGHYETHFIPLGITPPSKESLTNIFYLFYPHFYSVIVELSVSIYWSRHFTQCHIGRSCGTYHVQPGNLVRFPSECITYFSTNTF